jgi:hypothetical protein
MVVRSEIHPLRWAKTVPGAGAQIRLMRGSKEGVVNSAIFQQSMNLTVQEFNNAISMLPYSEHPADPRLASKEASLSMYAARFFTMGKSVIEMSPELVDELDHTTLGDVRVGDIKFPHRFFWMSLNNAGCGGLPGSDNRIDGAYVDSTLIDKNGVLQIVLTTRRADFDPESSDAWPARTESYFYVPCKFGVDDQRTFEEVLDQSISEGEIKLRAEFAKDMPMPGPSDSAELEDVEIVEVNGREMKVRWKDVPRLTTIVDTTRANDLREIERNQRAMPDVRRALSLVVNLLAYMSLPPDDIETQYQWASDAPPELIEQSKNGTSSGKRQWASEQLANLDFNRIKIVGLKSHPRLERQVLGEGNELQFSHIRIGHFRTQVYGPSNSLRKLIWVPSVRVRPDLEMRDDRGGRQYVVEKREDAAT